MGNSVHAHLAFGINFDDNNPVPDRFESLTEYIMDEKGIKEVPYVDEDKDPEEYKKWSRHRGHVHVTENSYPLELLWHCSSYEPCYALVLRNREYIACRGDISEFKPSDLTVSPEEIQYFKDFCEKNDLSYSEPTWFIAPYSE